MGKQKEAYREAWENRGRGRYTEDINIEISITQESIERDCQTCREGSNNKTVVSIKVSIYRTCFAQIQNNMSAFISILYHSVESYFAGEFFIDLQ